MASHIDHSMSKQEPCQKMSRQTPNHSTARSATTSMLRENTRLSPRKVEREPWCRRGEQVSISSPIGFNSLLSDCLSSIEATSLRCRHASALTGHRQLLELKLEHGCRERVRANCCGAIRTSSPVTSASRPTHCRNTALRPGPLAFRERLPQATRNVYHQGVSQIHKPLKIAGQGA